jgi:glycosyltransferase involved in cell wall biosynthesis
VTGPAAPRFTFIVAVYGVERFLPAFLASVEAQAGGLHDSEWLFVDDGSPDGAPALVEQWLARTGIPGRLLRKENGGAASARNHGLAQATGQWLSFPDPDDILRPG